MDVASKSEWCFSGALSSVTALFSDKITLSVRQCQECLQPISHSAIQQKKYDVLVITSVAYVLSALLPCVPHQLGSPIPAMPIICTPKINKLKLPKTQPRCMWNGTSFEQHNFYSSIKCCLSPANNNHKAKLRKKPHSSPLHAGQRGRTTRNSSRESQQDKLDHLELGHHKISHCSNFIYKTWTNIKLGEQIPNTINRDYTYGLMSLVSLCRSQESLSQQQDGAALPLSRPYRLSQLSWDTTPPPLLLRTMLVCQPNAISFGTTTKKEEHHQCD